LIEGPKWCGKTTTAEKISTRILYMDDPETKKQNIAMPESSSNAILCEKPRWTDSQYRVGKGYAANDEASIKEGSVAFLKPYAYETFMFLQRH
jgi:hypothetical protein